MSMRNPRRGSVMLEFGLTAIPAIMALVSLFGICLGMWQYHTLAEAVNLAARTASVHGAGCASSTCATTVDTVAHQISKTASGVPDGLMNVTLSSTGTGTTPVTCNPLNNCYGNSAKWPSLAANLAGTTNISITASYSFTAPVSIWLPVYGTHSFNPVTLAANSTQTVVY